jgi:DNA-binding XRE family transcriptional regulator
MKRARLENVEIDLKEKLRNPKLRKLYEIECAKVELAQKIAQLREDNHLNQSDLAKKMHVSQQFISQIETGQAANLTLDTLLKIAKSLGRGIKISFPEISKQGSSLKIA